MNKALVLIRTWLLIDFFGDARRAGAGHSSSLTTTIFAQAFFGFVFAALLYPDTPPVPFAAANLCLSSLLIAIGALGDESRPERRAADEHLLHGTPVSRLVIALARGGHAAFAVVLVTIGMALAPAILLAHLAGEMWLAPAYIVGACASSGLASGVLGVFGRASSRWLGTARTALLMGSAKALLLGAGLVLFATSLPRLQGTADGLPLGRSLVEWMPPYAIARWLAAPSSEWSRLVPLAIAALALLALAMLTSGQGSPASRRVRGQGPSGFLLQRLCADGRHRGIAEFVAVSMWRSAAFRARVLPLLGIPAAMVLLVARREPGPNDFTLACVLLQLPAIYLPFLVAFLPRGDQPGTAWIFGQAPGLSRELVHDATWRALVTHVLLPVHAIGLALAIASGSHFLDLAAASVFAFGLAVLAARGQVRALATVPFTQGKELEGGLELGALFGNALTLGAAGLAFARWAPEALRWPLAAVVVAAATFSLRRPCPAGTTPLEDLGAEGPAPEGGEEAKDRSTEPTAPAEDPDEPPAKAPPSLRGELRAIATLYVILCVLPMLVGTMFAP